MKCDFCKKPLRHPKIVHTASGAFHGECLDKLHAATEAFGQIIGAFIQWDRKGKPADTGEITNAIQSTAGPMSAFLKQAAENARRKEQKRDTKPNRG